MQNRILDLFDRMKVIETTHAKEIDAISRRYRVDELAWIGLTAVWTVLLDSLNEEEVETIKGLLSLGRERFNKQPLSIRVGFITFPKYLFEEIRNAGRSLLPTDPFKDDPSDEGK